MAQLDHLAQCIPHAELVKLVECGHSPHRDQALATMAAVEEFLKPLLEDV
jgi:pimeloyl-ACP methyl ester carboxylesterase